ncbi:hypothetical protein CDO73_09160 [Saccharibacillus sp. O23]|uniref:VWA domain-containing protein n=1 Tax=Saccharibacillus sp. O23 TaxID=2009338 RepID=UPI000B4E23FA|nr:VWA domain-containing protein [Saccharibacillus sp. O23]OWR30750.1 hypothetical protein CDO73_09160 [Saccharibacillus sp. O23]
MILYKKTSENVGVMEMFCHHCGAQVSENSRFCTSCGKSLSLPDSQTVQEKQPTPNAISDLPVSEQLARSSEIYPPLPAKNPLRKWLILSTGALVVLLSLLLWNQQSGTSNSSGRSIVSAEQEPLSNSSSEESAAPAQSLAEKKEAASPAYIRINQVDSAEYDQGKVDVYFSLFADPELEQPLNSDQLNKTMFNIDGKEVSEFAPVLDNDSVSVNLVLDKSASMDEAASSDTLLSKIDLVRSAATDFIQSVPSDAKGQFAMMSFSSYAPSSPDLPFTFDLEKAAAELRNLESDGGETALYDSLTEALYATDLQHGPKYIIAFTDGYDSGYGASAQSVIALSRQLGIPIYTVGFGDKQTALEDIAAQTGGQSYTISEQDDLREELKEIYSNVFARYTQQYKITYSPSQRVDSGQDFSLSLDLNAPLYAAHTGSLVFTRKADSTLIDVQSGLSEYQTNYTRAVNELDFGLVSGNIDPDSDFYGALLKRIEIDYANKPKMVDPIQNAGIQSIKALSDRSYEIKYFKLFGFEEEGTPKYEADLNTYVMTKNSSTSKWQVSKFLRDECSIYRDEYDSGSACGKGENREFSGNPWTYN